MTDPEHIDGAEQVGSSIPESAVPGVVVRAHGKFYEVQEIGGDRTFLAELRGSIKRYRQKTGIVAVGDRVLVTELDDGEGRIESVLPRRSVLQRPGRGPAGTLQVILANPDQALFMFSVAQPDPHRRMLDRFLILSEATGVPALIGINKLDLDSDDDPSHRPPAHAMFEDYQVIYPVFYFSAKHRIGLDPVADALHGKLTVIAGPSGVGKSSLLNALDPGGDRAIQAISDSTGKGRHTTTSAQIYRLGPDTFVADTPGMRALAMSSIVPEVLDQYFPEFRPMLGSCFYADCKHLSEPGCAVIEAVERGEIPVGRYQSYCALRTGVPD
ncbi:ribosome small subunit-dependent GTPase A [soil metagenome]